MQRTGHTSNEQLLPYFTALPPKAKPGIEGTTHHAILEYVHFHSHLPAHFARHVILGLKSALYLCSL